MVGVSLAQQALAALGVEVQLEVHGTGLQEGHFVAQAVIAPHLGSGDTEPRRSHERERPTGSA